MRRRTLLQSGLGAVGSLLLAGPARGDGPHGDSGLAEAVGKSGAEFGKAPLEVRNLGARLDLIQGPGGNVVVLRGPDGLVVVDSGVSARGQEILETARRVGAGESVSVLINTHWHPDHAGGNEPFGRAGATIVASAPTRKRLMTAQSIELLKLTIPASPPAAWPILTFDEGELHVGDETIHLVAVPPAHTDGDLIAHFTQRDLIHTGDLFSNGLYPYIDGSSRGWIGGMIAAAERLLKLAGPNTKFIPGHGPIANRADLVVFRKMLVTVYDRVAPLFDAGKSADEVVAAKPTKDFDATWASGFFTGDMFTRFVHDGLAKRRGS
ncbi:Glyoxylase, beta-lactamase superfamily II [Singulisphaera sp. GP187]|uniref:MBL fold metallo-hydrolase n=1 Tax=Singulisphaera sp. GP187 TaxID=1882752 RepID=UPI0009284914|nr:MBL fold metallo-hydrolase [Singulisphaera sp. GP187]SIO38427.1 Glyoxylase, beta-lactamase superfamily II [Singulisphaera sp. GP187]